MMRYETNRHVALQEKMLRLNKTRVGATKKNFHIGEILGIGASTVQKYTQGRIADPYLAEDIINLIEQENG